MHARILGVVLIALGVLKLLDPGMFVRHVASLDLPWEASSSAIAWALIILETLLGVALLLGVFRVPVVVLTLIFTLGTVCYVLVNPGNQECGCFGGKIPASFGRRLALSAFTLYLATVHALNLAREAGTWPEEEVSHG